MFDKIFIQGGFIVVLDQSGGSILKVFKFYGIDELVYVNDDEMFDMVYVMCICIIICNVFFGECVLGVILFENILDCDIEGLFFVNFLW